MKTLVIMQARTTSTRLPGKALLPVAGYPSAVLAALRAGNRGAEVLLATSNDASDDGLTEVFLHHGIRVFRGPLQDVLGRYYYAAAELPEDCTVIRVTGDNLVPDGDLIAELTSAFVASGFEYLATDSRLPYGVAAEVFSVSALRRAHIFAASSYDREHVGPWMSRNCKSGRYIARALGAADYSHLRCTLDDEGDYQRILRLFHEVDEPVNVGWYELAQKLRSISGKPSLRAPFKVSFGQVHSELTLGTAQLGMEYGIVNRTGRPSESSAIAMVRHAIAHGVTTIDTARAYGEAEEILGRALSGRWDSRLKVVTKLDPLDALPTDASPIVVSAAVDDSIRRSCEALRTSQLDTLLLHRWTHRFLWDGATWRRLQELQQEGKISVLGASVYEPSEALDALDDPAIQHLQIPMNVLDRRWKEAGVDKALAQRRDVVVHARSAFLQGILIHGADRWPDIGDGYDAALCVDRLQGLATRFDRLRVADLCLAYVRAQPWITSVVVGCETMPQLKSNLELFRLPKLTAEQCEELEDTLPMAPDALLNPSRWNLAHESAACSR
jgi:aryl-alcohol dehydrogenase-like predicted oxidoreductase/spore coat polysaccharide biosynthesis protein SpsF (cytidylyltransferase family)